MIHNEELAPDQTLISDHSITPSTPFDMSHQSPSQQDVEEDIVNNIAAQVLPIITQLSDRINALEQARNNPFSAVEAVHVQLRAPGNFARTNASDAGMPDFPVRFYNGPLVCPDIDRMEGALANLKNHVAAGGENAGVALGVLEQCLIDCGLKRPADNNASRKDHERESFKDRDDRGRKSDAANGSKRRPSRGISPKSRLQQDHTEKTKSIANAGVDDADESVVRSDNEDSSASSKPHTQSAQQQAASDSRRSISQLQGQSPAGEPGIDSKESADNERAVHNEQPRKGKWKFGSKSYAYDNGPINEFWGGIDPRQQLPDSEKGRTTRSQSRANPPQAGGQAAQPDERSSDESDQSKSKRKASSALPSKASKRPRKPRVMSLADQDDDAFKPDRSSAAEPDVKEEVDDDNDDDIDVQSQVDAGGAVDNGGTHESSPPRPQKGRKRTPAKASSRQPTMGMVHGFSSNGGTGPVRKPVDTASTVKQTVRGGNAVLTSSHNDSDDDGKASRTKDKRASPSGER